MKKSVFRNSIFNAVYQGATLIFPFLTSIYVARIFGSEVIGSVSYAQTFASYFVSFASSGLPTYGLREIAKLREQINDKSKVFTELFIINGVLTTISLAVYVFLLFTNQLFIRNFALSACFVLLIFWNYLNVDWFFMGEEEYRYIAIRSLIIKIVCFLFLFILVRNKKNYIEYALLICIGIGANNVFNIIHIKKFVKIVRHNLNFKRHLRSLFILALSLILDTLYSKSDIIMLGIMSSETAVGVYTYGHKIPEIIMTVCVSFTAVLFPRLSYYYINNRDYFMRLLNDGIKVVSFITIPACIGYFIISPEIMFLLYGNEFLRSINITRIFSLMIVIKGFGNLLGFQLVICTGNEQKRVPIYCVAVVVNILLNFLLIPQFESIGAALASVVCELIVNIYLIQLMHKQMRYSLELRNILKCVIGGAIMAFTVNLVLLTEINYILKIFVCMAVGVITYTLCGFILKNDIVWLILNKFKNRKVS